jgi:hypothetical protein
LSRGRAERHGFEYYRHGTLSLYAALDVKTGAVRGMTAARHTSREFITFLRGLVQRAEHAREIHVALDIHCARLTFPMQTSCAPGATWPSFSGAKLDCQPGT